MKGSGIPVYQMVFLQGMEVERGFGKNVTVTDREENVGKRKDELKLGQACVLKERRKKQEQSEGDERPSI